MTCELVPYDLEKVFRVAVLLTGCDRSAEAAVLAGIEALCPDEVTDETLLKGTIRACIKSWFNLSRQSATHRASPALPVELQRVISLPAELRFPFVLRVLAAIPLETCASLLQLETQDVTKLTSAAIQALASVDGRALKNRSRATPLFETTWSRGASKWAERERVAQNIRAVSSSAVL